MPAPTVVNTFTGTGTTSVSVTLSGVSAGDLILVLVGFDVDIDFATPSGYTKYAPGSHNWTAQGFGAATYYKIASGGESNVTLTRSGGVGQARATVLVLSGVDSANPLNTGNWSENASSSNPSVPSITPGVADCLLVAFAMVANSSTTSGGEFTPPSGYTERSDLGGAWCHTSAATKALTGGSGSPTGTASFTYATGASVSIGVHLAIAPAASAVTGTGALAQGSQGLAATGSVGAAGSITGTAALAQLAQQLGASGTFFAPSNLPNWWTSGFFQVTPALYIANSSNIFVDRTIWFDEADWEHIKDQPGGRATIKLRRDTLNPEFTTALALDRRVKLEVTCQALTGGASVTYNVFEGYVDDIDWDSDPLVVKCRDYSGLIQDTPIKLERTYGSASVQGVMQTILNDNGLSAISLYTPVSPGWTVPSFKQKKQNVLEALRALAAQIGWDVRYLWDSGISAWRLTLYLPPRTKNVPDYTLDDSHYLEMRGLGQSVKDIKNSVTVIYLDASGNTQSYNYQGATVGAGARERWFELSGESTRLVSDTTRAQAMAQAAVADLERPKASIEVSFMLAPFFRLDDMVRLSVNPNLFGQKDLSVVGLKSRISPKEMRTSLMLREGSPLSYTEYWLSLQRGADGFVPRDSNPAGRTPSDPTSFTLATNVELAGQSTFVSITASWAANARLDAAYYEVEYRRTSTTAWTRDNTRDTSYRIAPVPGGIGMEVRVRAVGADGTPSGWVTSSITSANDTGAPAQPTGLIAQALPAAVQVNWTKGSDLDLDIYEIYSATSPGFTPNGSTLIGKIKASQFYHGNLTPGVTRYYKVIAVDISGNTSSASSEASAIPLHQNFENLAFNPGFEQGNTGWDKTAGAAITQDPANARSGNFVGRIVGSGIGSYESLINWNARVPCTPGDVFYFETYVKGGSSGTAQIGLRITNKDGSFGYLFASQGTSGSYQKLASYFTIPANTVEISSLYLEVTGTGTWYFDDVYVRKASSTVDIVSGAVSQYQAIQVVDNNGFSTTSGPTYVDIPGFSITFSLSESALVMILLTADMYALVSQSASPDIGASAEICLNVDGTDWDSVAGAPDTRRLVGVNLNAGVSNIFTQLNPRSSAAIQHFSLMAAGSHTIKGRLRKPNGSSAVVGSRNLSALILKR